jgi:hypothetical protein
MARKIRSVSLSEEQCNWLDRHENISLSDICQAEIERLIQIEKSLEPSNINSQRLEDLRNQLYKRVDFIEKKGLMDDYLKEVEKI